MKKRASSHWQIKILCTAILLIIQSHQLYALRISRNLERRMAQSYMRLNKKIYPKKISTQAYLTNLIAWTKK